ncbi:hypothetical protein [Brevibacillus fortis]|uniref:hypothetical protein n=1 Tax=Brevibacillus fortis TaxID=2126352 RepID=UPI0038FC9F66
MNQKVSVKYFDIPDKYVELDSPTVYSIAEKMDFVEYCKEHYSPKNLRYYFTDKKGRKVSPRWIITYLFHTGSDLLRHLNDETEVEVYSNTYSAINIFNKIGVKVEEKNRYLD